MKIVWGRGGDKLRPFLLVSVNCQDKMHARPYRRRSFFFLFLSFWQISCSPRQLNLDDERALFSLSSAVHNGRTFHSLTVCIYHVLRFNLTAANSVGIKQTKHTSDTKESHIYVCHAIGAIDRRLLWNKNVHIFTRRVSKAFLKCCKVKLTFRLRKKDLEFRFPNSK
jgi:hypothetical protein